MHVPTPSTSRLRARVWLILCLPALAALIFLLGLSPLSAQAARSVGAPAASRAESIRHQASAQPITDTGELSVSLHLPIVLLAPPVSPQYREDSLRFYRQEYLASEGTPFSWTGNLDTCDPGDTTPEFRAATLRRVNYFRAMAGVPDWVTLSDDYNRKAQAAALMMVVNERLSHYPTEDWTCYSDDGAEGASHSNLTSAGFGWKKVDGYMWDSGENNYYVGHRRWILYPQTRKMGTGDVPSLGADPRYGANALWVVDDSYYDPRPETRHPYVAWPPPGYVPYQVVYPRWSFSYPYADFSAARVVMTSAGSDVGVVIEDINKGAGENTLVWIPLGLGDGDRWPKPAGDTKYTVTVSNIQVGDVTWEFTYDVVVFDPDA